MASSRQIQRLQLASLFKSNQINQSINQSIQFIKLSAAQAISGVHPTPKTMQLPGAPAAQRFYYALLRDFARFRKLIGKVKKS